MNVDKRILLLGSVAAALVLVTGGLWLSREKSGDQFAQCRQSVVAGGMEAFGGPFELTNQSGERVTDQQVFEQPSLLYFGYTYCPDVCPLDSARNAEASALLAENNMSVKPVFITVDPKRDTPEVVQQFVNSFSESMVGLTGTQAEVEVASKAWRNYYQLHDQEDPENYLVDHATTTYLVLPGHGTVEYFNRSVSAEDMAKRVGCFVDAAS